MSTIPDTHEAIGQLVAGGTLVSFQLPTRKPGHEQLLVRVLWSIATPVSLWIMDFGLTSPTYPLVIGENIVGEVVSVGEDVDFKPGDKILSFSFADNDYGRAAQEYSLLSKWSVCKLPENITPQEAATVPDNLVTAYFSLFDQIGLPVPSELPSASAPQDASTPIVIWGAGGSVGQYAVQLLRLAGYKKIFAVASSRHHAHLRSLGASATFDYSSPDVAKQIAAEAGGNVKFVYDVIGDEEYSLKPISQIVGEGSKVAYLLPVRVGGQGAVQGVKRTSDIPFVSGVKLIPVGTKYYQGVEVLKRELQPKIVPDLLSRGLIKPNRVREIEGANLLERASKGWDLLRRGEVSGERLVFRVST